MRLALGLSVHTGWAACIVAGGSLRQPHVAAREHVSLVEDPDRFVFHRAAEMNRAEAVRSIAHAREEAVARATAVFRRLADGRELRACAIVAKSGPIPDLDTVLAAHPRIHTAEGAFYRDVLAAAATESGIAVHLVHPSRVDAKAPGLVAVGRAVGKPWNRDWKLAALAAWHALAEGRDRA
jgi:hypothetical protein